MILNESLRLVQSHLGNICMKASGSCKVQVNIFLEIYSQYQ
jgi:hypothetical protein